MTRMTVEKFNEINLKYFEGYMWYSDAEKPKINEFEKLETNKIPFVIEGYLYSKKSKTSISIKNINGEYLITKFILSEYDDFELSVEIAYPAYKLGNIETIKYRELHKKVTEDLDFYSYEKIAKIFVGFGNDDNNKK